jgi:hypothetical protein
MRIVGRAQEVSHVASAREILKSAGSATALA